MGLDTVELVFRVEETFGVDLPNDELGSVQTVGELYHLLLSKLDATPVQHPDREEVWRVVQDIFVDQLQIDREEVVPEANILRDLRCD